MLWPWSDFYISNIETWKKQHVNMGTGNQNNTDTEDVTKVLNVHVQTTKQDVIN